MKELLSITRKELNNYFSSPTALIFVGVFLLITFFAFFAGGISLSGVGEGFFARGIADLRLLFQSMPILLIFLIAALTMRQWSEEQQTGTLELLLTMPVKLWQLVLGKFLAVLALVAVALSLTLSLTFMVAVTGNLDFGPVIGGYLAALLMASAYIAIGLFMSSLTDEQLVALILTVIVGGLFYLVGSPPVTDLFNNTNVGEALRAVGTGSRFASIERGVIDIRDLVYYLSLTVAFLSLNILSLDTKRWSTGAKTREYRFNQRLTTFLVVFNLIFFNILIYPFDTIRLDLTASQEYTLAPVTRDLLQNLQEPLLVRGYFSEETHPLIAPLIPQVRDTLEEYQVVAGTEMDLEFLDPITDPELEAEANQTYGIQPTPLQFSGRGGTSLVNAYLDILIRYGDQVAVLNLLDLIEVDQTGTSPNVRLRNLEYDLTSNIQRVVFGFQSIDAVLAGLEEPATLTLYVTPDTLPEQFTDAPARIEQIASEIAAQSNGKFNFQTVNLSEDTSIDRLQLAEQYRIQPIAADIFAQSTFYLHMLLQAGGETQVIYPTGTLSETEVRTAIESGLKRASSGFLEVVGIWTPPTQGQINPMTGQQEQSLQQYNTVASALRENYEVRPLDLSTGEIPGDLDAALIIGPQNMTDIERYAIDQYLMRGGSVFVAAGNYQLAVDQMAGQIGLLPVEGGLQEMLAHYGVTVEPRVVVDTQNTPFPIPSGQNLVNLVDYPAFVDVRPNTMDRDNPIVSGLPALTVNWGSPITLDETLNADRTVSLLLQTTDEGKLSDVIPGAGLQVVYPQDGEAGRQTLAVAVTGGFASYFADRPSPFEQGAEATPDPALPPPPAQPGGFLSSSPETARLVVIGSSEFVNDNIFQLSASIGEDRATLNTVQFISNTIDWFTEDTALASIRASGATARLLNPLTDEEQSGWETGNYLFAVISIVVLGVVWQLRRRAEQPMELVGYDSEAATSPITSGGEA
ncbi:MAG: Gldg family protein [bacterium]|nr:Gldg family protein [bacterium]